LVITDLLVIAVLKGCHPRRPLGTNAKRHYANQVPRIRVERPRGVLGVVRSLSSVAAITLVVLKLARVVTWSWWWVLSPMWIGVFASVLLAGGLIIVWCLALWLEILVNRFRWPRRRQSPVVFDFDDMDADPDASELSRVLLPGL
jgi:hypothetical protein